MLEYLRSDTRCYYSNGLMNLPSLGELYYMPSSTSQKNPQKKPKTKTNKTEKNKKGKKHTHTQKKGTTTRMKVSKGTMLQ